MKDKYDLKTHILGPDDTDEKEVCVLSRLLSWHTRVGISYEADPRHAQSIIKDVLGKGPVSRKPAVTTAIKAEIEEDEEVERYV